MAVFSLSLVQSALEVKQAELDKKARELREVRQALHDKGRELEQASLQLLEKQEELEVSEEDVVGKMEIGIFFYIFFLAGSWEVGDDAHLWRWIKGNGGSCW